MTMPLMLQGHYDQVGARKEFGPVLELGQRKRGEERIPVITA